MPDLKNMNMPTAFFRQNNEVYTLCSLPRKPSFVIRWSPYRPNEKAQVQWRPDQTSEVHNNPSVKMRPGPDGDFISISTCDGMVIFVDDENLAALKAPEKIH